MKRTSFLVAGLLLCTAGCTRQSAVTPSEDEAAAEAPVQESWDVLFSVFESRLGSDASQPRTAIRAGYMAKYERGDTSYVVLQSDPDTARTPVTATLYDEAGAAATTVTARRLIYYERGRRFEARGDVRVETRAGKRLQSEELFWNETERKVRTPGFTRITTPTEQIQGYGLVADENLDTYTLARVAGQVTVEEE